MCSTTAGADRQVDSLVSILDYDLDIVIPGISDGPFLNKCGSIAHHSLGDPTLFPIPRVLATVETPSATEREVHNPPFGMEILGTVVRLGEGLEFRLKVVFILRRARLADLSKVNFVGSR